ncbi:MAG: DUF3817 domain-containing protein [Chitinophagaceae bacterium]
MRKLSATIKTHVRLSALLEGISYLLLLGVAMPLKYFAGLPHFVQYIGLAHGILFIWYILSVLFTKAAFKLSLMQTGIALVGSLLPLGTFYADKKIFKKLNFIPTT